MNYLVPVSGRQTEELDSRLVRFLAPKDASQLIHRIQHAARDSGKVVEFIGSQGGEGTSSIARDFAILMTQRSNRPILLLDLDLPINGHRAWFAQNTNLISTSIKVVIPHGRLMFHRVGSSPLVISELVLDSTAANPLNDLIIGRQTLDQLRDVFSLIIADAPPLAASFEGVAFSANADATVMVVEAERTRAPVALDLSERLKDMGAQLVGFVFNKRRFYVPDFLYREL
jgi:Mrp family chromosome partitioning ATPase